MTGVASPVTARAEFLLEMSALVEGTFRVNLEGVTHEESVVQPPSGNCINWNVGHLVTVHNNICALLGLERVGDQAALKRYERGSAPLTNPAEAMRLEKLIELWNSAVEKAKAGLKTVSEERLTSPAPMSPRNKPDETIGSLLTVTFFHQSYHVGSLAVLRRLVGKPGAIK